MASQLRDKKHTENSPTGEFVAIKCQIMTFLCKATSICFPVSFTDLSDSGGICFIHTSYNKNKGKIQKHLNFIGFLFITQFICTIYRPEK